MTNHAHLVIQVADIPLSQIMQNIAFRYTRWVNWRQNRSGHLFQGRYKAVLVDADSYLLELMRYVHLNPVRAGMATSPDLYPWTGHHAYCREEELPWLTTEWALSMLAANREDARGRYISFVHEGLEEGRRPEFHGEGGSDGRIFGDDDFRDRIMGESERLPEQATLDDVMNEICRHYGINAADLALPGKNRQFAQARGMAAWIVQGLPSITLSALARRTERDVSSLSAAAWRLQLRAATEPELSREKDEVLGKITIYKA